MIFSKLMRKGFPGLILGWVARLRFPYIVLLMGTLFLVNLIVPDVIPFADEILMGLLTVLLTYFKKKPGRTRQDSTTA